MNVLNSISAGIQKSDLEDIPEDKEPLLEIIKKKNQDKMTSYKPEVDPFYSVRDNITSQLEKIKSKYENFQDLVKNSDTATNTEFKEVRKALVKDLRAADKDLKVLHGGVEMIEKNRSKFPHIKDSELSNRKKFVDSSQNVINDIKAGIDSNAVRRKIEDDDRKNKHYEESTKSMRDAVTTENTKFIKSQKQQTMQMIEQQDKDLDALGHSVDRLGQIGREINQEVKEQTILLDNLGNEIDESGNKMNVVQEALSKLLKTKDGCQIWTIVILGVILVILVCLVIWLP